MPRVEQTAPKKPYVHENFPTWRHHALYESKLVHNQAQLAAETPDEDGWSDSPPTTVASPAPPVARASAAGEVRSESGHEVMRAAFNTSFERLEKSNHALIVRNNQLEGELEAAYGDASALRNQNQALKVEIEALKARKPSATQFQKKSAATEVPTGATAPAEETTAGDSAGKAAE